MNPLQKLELEKLLADWKAGKEIRSVQLGPAQTVLHRQEEIHGWAFHLIAHCLTNEQKYWVSKEPAEMKALHEHFVKLCDWLESDELPEILPKLIPPLQQDELDGAESLAWVALTRGWSAALLGYPDTRLITVRNTKVKKLKSRSA
jgi:hypothetical protein